LHGITVPGRHHVALRRMGRALAAAGHVAVIPEVARWRDLEVTSREVSPAVGCAYRALQGWPQVDPDRIGLMGFSVAATWAVEHAAAEGDGRFAAVVGMGGYGDLERMLRAMVVGEYEWEGVASRYTPDPYGRWIMGGTLLPVLDGDTYGDHEARVAAGKALRSLAVTAGRHGAYAGEPVYDAAIADLRARLPVAVHPAWDLLAPPSARLVPDVQAGRMLADAMAAAALRGEPELDPRGRLDGLRTPAALLHGEADRLIPYSETLRLAQAVPREQMRSVTVTKLLGHTKRAEAASIGNPRTLVREARSFTGFIRTILRTVERR
jgi:dienelactone hydrolase